MVRAAETMIPCILNNLRPEFLRAIGLEGVTWRGRKVLVVVGPNAVGKSMFRRAFCGFLKKRKLEVIHLSQEGRGDAGFVRAMVYGNESNEATSVISAKTLVNGLRTSRGREKNHVLLYDEPEIGMAEEMQVGAAQWLAEELRSWPDKLSGIIVMTHSRHFVRELIQLPRSGFICLGGRYSTADAWLNREIKPVGPEAVIKLGLRTFRKLTKILNAR